MRATRKITSLFLVMCMVISVFAVGIVPAAADTTYETYAQDTIEGSAILHCFDWSYNNIKAALSDIAAAGYTAVQTSPVQSPKDYSSSWTDGANQWWKLYQPLGFSVSDGSTWLGTKAELTSLCTEAEKYGIKVVVDIVANHVANNGSSGGGYSYVNSGVESQLQNSTYYHSSNTGTSDDSRYTITQYHLGMPDLNTANTTVQGRVTSLLKECIDCGVDGFRFDAAKHIELPTDTDANCASDFWPNVLNAATSYASQKGVDTPFYYGEILGSAGTDISNYTTYMAVTDNYTGDRALDKAYWSAASELADSTYYKGASASKSVLWVESHDTYMGSSGSAYFSNTQSVDDDDIIRAWAIVGARADSTALYFARPNDTMGAAGTDTTWKSTAVAEVNKFKNHFDGTTEYLASSGNTAYIERGTKGVVISKLDGSGSVSLTANRMASGTYTDQITGNTFTVSNGTISGTVGSTGVAVVYNASDDALSYITESTLYLEPNSNWTSDGARFAMYLYNSSTGSTQWVSMTSAGDGYYSASVPSGSWTNVIFCRMDPATSTNSWDNKWNKTADLYPDSGTNCYTVADDTWDEGGGTWSTYGSSATTAPATTAPATTAPATSAPATSAPATEAPSSDTYTIYAINDAGWSKVNVHYWGDGETTWPGTAMTSISGTKVYSFELPKNVSGIVFTNGNSSGTKQTGDITSGFSDGATWTIGAASSNNYPVSTAPDYYLVGTMNSWTNNNNYKFSIHESDSGKLEYKLSGVQLAANAEFKVHSSSDSWYPSGSNHSVSSAGIYDIYFRPNGDGNSDWLADSNDSNKKYVYLAEQESDTYYTVTWKNDDGTTLATDSVLEGTTPTYSGSTPTKASTNEKTYTFSGWSPTVSAVTADVTYTAQFTESTRTYTITWKNYDGTVLETDTDAAYGSTPSYDGATPTRSGGGGPGGATSYVFAGWSPTVTTVTGDTTYTAKFSRKTRSYTITWVDGDGNTIKTETVLQNVMPAYTGATPTKTATAQYTYTYNGTWTPGVVAAQANATYTANFDTTVNTYTVTWKNGDTTLETDENVAYGTTPSYDGATPTKASTLTKTYTFSGWSPTVAAVTGDVTYTAQFTEAAVSTYDITVTNAIDWDDVYVYYWNGDSNNTWPGAKMTADANNFICTASIPATATGVIFNNGKSGDDLEQTGDITAGIADDAWWAVSMNGEDLVVNAVPTYYLVGSMTSWGTETAPSFTPFQNESKAEEYKLTTSLSNNAQIKVFGNEKWYPSGGDNNYTVTADGTYDVYFRPNGDGNADWHENYFYVDNVTTYTVTWKNGDTTIKTDTVSYGDTPAYTGTTPAKDATAQYTYTFSGWKKTGDDTVYTSSFPAVTSDVTYSAQFSETVNTYTVTWKNHDGTVLETDENVAYGATPSYDGATPTKAATAEYTYTFSGWSPAIATVTGDVIYTAQFSTGASTYTVTWKNEDGTVLETDEDVAYGTTPRYDGATPTKAATAQYTYTFSGWSPTIAAVSSDVIYTAQFTSTVNEYTITWIDGNGATLKTEQVAYGATPAYTGETPTKTATAQYTYTFNNTWSPEITAVTADATYTAQFTSTVNEYTITFKDADGTVLQSTQVAYGTVPTYNGEPPAKASTLTKTYTFAGWDKEPTAVTGAAAYTATYTESNVGTINISVINSIGWDNVSVYYWLGEEHNTWPGTAMTADASGMIYTASIPATAAGIVFTDGAQDNTKQTADVTTGITDGARWAIYKTTGDTDVHVHPVPTYYLVGSMTSWTTTGAAIFAPSKNEDGLEEYKVSTTLSATDSFKAYGSDGSWYPDGEGNNYELTAAGTYDIYFRPNGDGNADWHYSVLYAANVTTYTITWKNGDTVLDTDTVTHGDTPAYTGETPTKAADAQYTYTFSGWSPTIEPATADKTYSAVFDRTVNEYTITWVDGNGATLKTEQVAYGETPAYTGETPTKTATDQYTYTFNNTWTPEITAVTADATYTAQFDSTVNKYEITWKDGDGATLKTEQVAYGETPAYTGDTPTKTATDQYTYTFNNTWTPEITAVTGNKTYTAQFDSTVNKYEITWKDGDGETLKTEEVAYGQTPAYTGETPTKTATDQYTYTFNNTWSPEITAVTGNKTYTAQFDSTVNKYTITFKNGDDVLQSSEVEYGSTPAYTGDTPTKASTAQYTYTFSGWSPEIDTVRGEATYTAQFSSTVNGYAVTWLDDDNTELEKDENVPYGTVPSYDGAAPAKAADSEYIYTFGGWTPLISAVTGDVTYTAQYTQTPRLAGNSISLNGSIGVNFYMNFTDQEISDGVTVAFSWDVEGNTKTHSVTLTADDKESIGYKATCPIAIAEMTYEVTAAATVGDITITDHYSAVTYANTILSDGYKEDYLESHTAAEYEKLETLVKTMLDYGSKAQIRFNRNTDHLANGGTDYYTGAVEIPSSASDMNDASLSECGLQYVGTSVVYLNKTTLRHYYKIVDPGLFTGEIANAITFDGKAVEYGTKDGMIYFDKPDISASQLDTEYVLRINGHDYLYSALDYSALSYSSDSKEYENSIAKQLAAAVYRYNAAANAYFND